MTLPLEELCVAELFRELVEPIASFLDIPSVGRLLCVCKKINQGPSVQRVWKALAEEIFVSSPEACKT